VHGIGAIGHASEGVAMRGPTAAAAVWCCCLVAPMGVQLTSQNRCVRDPASLDESRLRIETGRIMHYVNDVMQAGAWTGITCSLDGTGGYIGALS
jgi:hypothetical protein